MEMGRKYCIFSLAKPHLSAFKAIMANILFIMLPETGHLHPTFKIASVLKAHGHRVFYAELREWEEAVVSQGMEFLPLFASLFSEGWAVEEKFNISPYEAVCDMIEARAAAIGVSGMDILNEELRVLCERAEPDLIVVDYYTGYLAVAVRESKIPCVVLNTNLAYLHDIAALRDLPRIILCPEEFDFPHVISTREHEYAESSLHLQRGNIPFPWEWVDEGKRLVYCSLGTQSHWSYRGADHERNQRMRRHFLQTVVNAMASRQDYQLVVSIGSYLRAEDFHPVPTNALLVSHTPQIDILKRASLMITHGGLNTIKECIFFGVPMIVFPLVGDQFGNAERVVHHKLGLSGNIATASVGLIDSLLGEIERNPTYRLNVESMREVFRKKEGEERAVKKIESVIQMNHRSAMRPG